MRQNIFILTLALTMLMVLTGCGCDHEWNAATCITPKTCVLCNETEGEALGHTWEAATCLEPEKCSVCHETKGEALGHNWEDATTEAPKTCTNCQTTEGSKLNTDPRFTTASTKELYGKWACEMTYTDEMMGTTGYLDELSCTMHYEFSNVGDLICTVDIHDQHAYLEAMKKMTRDVTIQTLAYQGFSESQVDEVMKAAYGMTLDEYVNKSIEAIDLDEIFGAARLDWVYYVGQNGLYSSDSWLGEFQCEEYMLEGDTLTIQLAEPLGDLETLVLTRVEE